MPPVNPAPYEVIGSGDLTIYLAPVGTAFPALGATPGAPWAKVGKSGNLSYFEDGITISHEEETTEFVPLGSLVPRKLFRVRENSRVKVKIADVSLDALSLALNYNAVDDTVIGQRSINLTRGFGVNTRALLVVGISAEGDAMVRHYEINVAAPMGNPQTVFVKGEAAGLDLEWRSLADDNGDVGQIIDEEAST